MNENNEIPLDDQGIRNDEIIDILEKLIKDTWQDVVNAPKALSFKERKDVAMTMQIVWDLTRDVMDIDDKLRIMAEFFDRQAGRNPEDLNDDDGYDGFDEDNPMGD